MEDELKRLRQSYEDLDARVRKTENNIIRIDEQVKNTNSLLEKNNEILDKLDGTMISTRETMQSLKGNIDVTNAKIDTMNKELTNTKNELLKIQEDSQFNVMEWVKKNFPTIAILVALAGFYIAAKF